MTQPYSLTLDTAPASEPLTLAEAKLYLRADGSEENDLVTAMITAVRVAAEQYLRRALVTQRWKLSADDYLWAETALPFPPVQSVESVTLVARDGSTTVMDSNGYYLNARKDKIIFDASPLAHRVEVVFESGYGDAEDVPVPIKQGMLLHLAELYHNRTGMGEIPAVAMGLYAAYRVMGV